MIIDPVRIEIQNFRKFDQFEFDFSNGPLTLIQGPNGSGKTTIFESIYTCLFNRRVDGRPASAAIRNGTDSAHIVFECDIDGIRYVFDRTIGKGAKFHITVDGDVKSNTTENKALVESMISPDLVRLSMLKPVKIKDIIPNIIDLDSFVRRVRNAISEKIIPEIHSCETRISKISGAKEVLQNNLVKYQNDLQMYEKNLASLQEQLKGIRVDFDTSDMAGVTSRISNYEKELQQTFMERNDSLNKRISDLNNKLYQITYRVRDLEDNIRKTNSFIGDGICPTCKQSLPDEFVEPLRQQVNDATNEIQTLQEQVKVLNQEKENLTNEAKNLTNSEWYKDLVQQLLTKYQLTPDMIDQVRNDSAVLKKKMMLEENIRSITSAITATKSNLESCKVELQKCDDSEISKLEERIQEMQKIKEDLELWTDTRTLKRAVIKAMSKALKSCAQKYSSKLLDIYMDLDDKGELKISCTNMNGEIISMQDLSRGETVMATLIMHLAIRDFISPSSDFRCILLDEFLDSLDEENSERVVMFLRELTENSDLKILVISHMNQNPDMFDYVLNMER